ncbi:MAG: ABC transporter ATP-binding protein [Clostridia bacterium]|nr:ABC transporter ATP-binding protein [Clostridia bacterium]
MSKTKQPKQKLRTIFKNNAIMLGAVARHTPDYFFLMIAEGVIWGCINSAVTVFNYNLLNAVDAGTDFIYAVKVILLMAGFYLLAFAFDKWYWYIRNPLMRKKLHLRMHEELFFKALSLDLSCFDDPEFYNDFVWAMNESDARAIEVVEDTGKLINRVVASFTLFGILITVDRMIAVILFLSSVVTVICNLIGNKKSFENSKELNPLDRKKAYINRVFHLSDYAKEMRIRRADELLLHEYDENTEKMIDLDKKYGKWYFLLYGLGWNVVGTVTFFAIILYMIFLLSTGELAVGGFAASVGVVWNVRWMLTDLIERLTKYTKHSLYIEKYLEFMRVEARIRSGVTDIPEFESLELCDVSFSYDFSDHAKYRYHEEDHVPLRAEEGKEALKHISLRIRAGEKIAIVGYNGAGKTTLIKLIMRLYDPTEGKILYNGVDIREYDPEIYRQKIGTVFQDFKIFATSIAENVMNGSYNGSAEEKNIVENALAAADFTDKLATLEHGIDTHLTREFRDDGTNLSGGEAQKIAISRVFAKNFPIVIMDEPSSALDPMAEYNLNQSILHNTEGKTVIFISHRLSTTRIADKIYMFDRGNLIEEGSHTELLTAKGKYAEMFRVQSEKYQVM